MEQSEKKMSVRKTVRRDSRLRQLLQVWRDYYDEIFEVDLQTGEFMSMMGKQQGRWPRSGFAEIELIILAEKLVHADDKEAFREFFDLDAIRRRIAEGVYVTKLNFRIGLEDGNFAWVKVKNIVPTKQNSDKMKFFSCFRRVDDETAADLKYKQELVDALENQRKLCEEKGKLIEKVADEIRSPLTAIIGMSALAKTDTSDPVAARERFKMIEQEGIKMNRVLKSLLNDNESEELPEFEFEDHPINKISYGRRPADSKPVADKKTEYDVNIPQNYAFIANAGDVFTPENAGTYVFKGKRVLIVEGNKMNAEVMRNLLERAQADYDIAGDGKEAVVKFVSKPVGTYDLILMDTELQILDGYSAAECIRMCCKDDAGTVPIFAVTSNAMTEDIRKSYAYGFNALFSRPVDFTMLFEKIKEQFYGIH